MVAIHEEPREPFSIALFDSIRATGLDSERMACLLEVFLRSPRERTVKSRDLSISCDIPLATATRILFALAERGVLRLDDLTCPHCGNVSDPIPAEGLCAYCGNDLELSDRVSVRAPGVLADADVKTLSRKSAAGRAANRLSDAWERNGAIYYLMLDLVGSENVQRGLGDATYTYFLNMIRDTVRYKVFSHLKGAAVSFGEVGDMHKVGFERFGDALEAVKLLSKNLPAPKTQSAIPEGLHFPRYSGTILKLELPVGERGRLDPRDLISVTMNGSPDINSGELTKYYRLDAKIDTEYSIYRDKCDISLWIFRPSEGELRFPVPESAWHSFKYEKHGIAGTEQAVLLYIKKGNLSGVEADPRLALTKT